MTSFNAKAVAALPVRAANAPARMTALAGTIAALFAGSASAATIVVNSLNDVSSAGDGQCTLREALLNADTNSDSSGGDCAAGDGSGIDTISLGNLTGTITLNGNALKIGSSVNLQGPASLPLTIDANNASRVFYIAGGGALDVTISALTLTHGKTLTGLGAAIEDNGQNLTLDHVTVVANAASAGGFSGAIVNALGSGVVTIRSSTISGNTSSSAASHGGAISVGGAGLVISDSQITGNSTAGKGGAIANRQGTGAITINNTVITGNSASGRGGALFLYRGNGAVTISNSTISGNTTLNRGGGIFLYNAFANVTISDTTIDNNNANAASGNGAGIFLYKSSAGVAVTIERCSISGNTAAHAGGGLFLYKTSGTTTIEDTTLSGNSSGSSGGAIFQRGPFGAGAVLNIRSSTLALNSATSSGGTLAGAGPVNVVNSILAGGTAASGPDIDASATGVVMNSSLLQSTSGTTLASGSANNLTNVDPQLSPLANNGGPTRSHRLGNSSPAKNSGTSSVPLPATDQRSLPRVISTIDMGSLEAQVAPLPFGFVALTGVPLSTTVSSSPLTLSLDQAAAIGVAGGSYSVNGGPYRTTSSVVSDGDVVTLQLLSSASYNSVTAAVLTVGGVSGTFQVTTANVDTAPDPYVFASQNGVAPGSVVSSDPAIIGGISVASPISISGGSYSINGGAFTGAAGTINNGDSLVLRQTASTGFSTQTTTIVTIGGISASFRVTTLAIDTTPDPFVFAALANAPLNTLVSAAPFTVSGLNALSPISIVGGEYSINGGSFGSAPGNVANGNSVTVRQTTSSGFSTQSVSTLTIGGVAASFAATTLAIDTTPDAFVFAARSNVAPGALVVSDPVTIAGTNAPSAVSVVGGEYSINAGAFTSVAGTINAGDTVTLRQTASASFSALSTSTLTVGGVSAAFYVYTGAADTTPDPFTFAAQTGLAPGAVATSTPVTISGIDAPTPISVAGGSYSINGGGFTPLAGSVGNGDVVVLRQTAAATPDTETTAVLTVGGVNGGFDVTTVAADSVPDAFSFPSQGGVAPAAIVSSAAISVSGINTATPIGVSNGSYSINGGPYVTAPGAVNNGDSVTLRQIASSSFDTLSSAQLTIGGVSGSFDVTTQSATTTLAITLTDHTAYARSGSSVNYIVSLSNSGNSTASGIALSGDFPPQIDTSRASWICIGANDQALCPSLGNGALDTSGITLPAGATLFWAITAPVLAAAPGDSLDYTVSARQDQSPGVSASDHDVLVLFRDGFDGVDAGASDVAGEASVAGACRATARTLFDDNGIRGLTVPAATAAAPVTTLLTAATAQGAGFRVESLALDGSAYVRLVGFSPDDGDQAGLWAATGTGTRMLLASATTGSGAVQILLEGAAPDGTGFSLSTILPGVTLAALQSPVPVANAASCE